MCSGFEADSYLRLIDFAYHSTPRLNHPESSSTGRKESVWVPNCQLLRFSTWVRFWEIAKSFGELLYRLCVSLNSSLYESYKEEDHTHPALSAPHSQQLTVPVGATLHLKTPSLECEDQVLDGPASGEKGSKGGPSMYCNPRT